MLGNIVIPTMDKYPIQGGSGVRNTPNRPMPLNRDTMDKYPIQGGRGGGVG